MISVNLLTCGLLMRNKGVETMPDSMGPEPCTGSMETLAGQVPSKLFEETLIITEEIRAVIGKSLDRVGPDLTLYMSATMTSLTNTIVHLLIIAIDDDEGRVHEVERIARALRMGVVNPTIIKQVQEMTQEGNDDG